jgi:hypothetical protein
MLAFNDVSSACRSSSGGHDERNCLCKTAHCPFIRRELDRKLEGYKRGEKMFREAEALVLPSLLVKSIVLRTRTRGKHGSQLDPARH